MADAVAEFIGITQATQEQAEQYLMLTDGNVGQAVTLYFDSGPLDLGGANAQPPVAASSQPTQGYREDDRGVVHLDSDDEMEGGYAGGSTAAAGRPAAASNTYEDDEAMARRLQEEFYGSGGGGAPAADEVRAPMARTTETLVGPGASWGMGAGMGDDDDMQAAVAEQMYARRQRQHGRAGIFNQQATSSSIWDADTNPTERRAELSRATGGASESSNKSNLLAEMYRPPFEIMARYTWEEARDHGKEEEKWIIVNVQDPAIFDCQVLNRDIWKNNDIKEAIKENFIFMQYNKDDPRGSKYIQYYFRAHESPDAYPHIGIVDPRTGEQVKVWSGPPIPKPLDFLAQLYEFLDRYSLRVDARNPVATRKPGTKKDVDVNRMSEEEMLEMALRNSMAAGSSGPRDDDPDALTRNDKGKGRAEDMDAADMGGVALSNGTEEATASPFAQISSTSPHTEPAATEPNTRIQFRHSGGRVIRRFNPTDPVRRIYEWLKAAPLEGKEGLEFELSFMGKNLIEQLDQTIEDAGLKSATIMIEFLE